MTRRDAVKLTLASFGLVWVISAVLGMPLVEALVISLFGFTLMLPGWFRLYQRHAGWYCEACDRGPAFVTIRDGRYCINCAPAIEQLAAIIDAASPSRRHDEA